MYIYDILNMNAYIYIYPEKHREHKKIRYVEVHPLGEFLL